jgi:hypothetical protein
MNTKTPSLLIAAMSVIFGFCSLFAAEAQVLTATTTELTTSDLASVLGVRYWSYRLCFEKPVEGITVRLCELRRQPDGSWKRTTLAGGHGFYEKRSSYREIPVTVLIHDQPAGEDDLGLRVGGDFTRSKLTTRPDFSNTYSKQNITRFFRGCLVLAIEESNPQIATYLESNFVRIIGLEIEMK